MDLKGFWSYVRADDQAEGERVSRLATDVRAQFEVLTGETISLFLDKSDIKWGDNWRQEIDSKLASVAFFVAVITPRYFMSSECRRELQTFARTARDLGVEDLVLPLLYIDVPALEDGDSKDELIQLVRTFQREDWREIRFADVSSEQYRRGVTRLATRFVEANKHADQVASAASLQLELVGDTQDQEDLPGFIDVLATSEEALPAMNNTLMAIGEAVNRVGEISSQEAEAIRREGTFSSRLSIVRRLSERLHGPSDRVWELSNDFVKQLHEVDAGLRLIIERAPIEIKENPKSRSDVCSLFASIRTMQATAHGGFGQIQELINTLGVNEGLSRDLRRPLRRLREGLTVVMEGKSVIDEWLQLVEGAPVECTGLDPAS